MTTININLIREIGIMKILLSSLLLFGFIFLMYQSGLLVLWVEDEQYGHGLMVVGLLGYLLYRRKEDYILENDSYAWLSIIISTLALIIFVVGDSSGISIIKMYSVWLFSIAVIFSIGGWKLFKQLIIPIFIVFILIPLPAPLGPTLTAKLQLVSSVLGVWVIRLFGGVVFLEGNVIDMGGVKLLVAEACAGLRYLFPLMSIGAIAGYIMHAPTWMRWAVFLITIPITIVMNSFRIGVTGLLVETWGSSHTEGFLHFFEGWVVFIATLAILLVFSWFLIKLIPNNTSLIKVFSLDSHNKPSIQKKNLLELKWLNGKTFGYMITCIVFAVVSSIHLNSREHTNIEHKPLSIFPLTIGDWKAKESGLSSLVEAVAGASEYYYGDYSSSKGENVNVYISYYESQRHGQIPHSPKVCIPGDGWLIKSITPVILKDRYNNLFTANRLVITKFGKTIITYYWLKQGNNMYSQEALARIDLIRISLMENRTDGALVRLVTEVASGESIHQADNRLLKFSEKLISVLSDYIPD